MADRVTDVAADRVNDGAADGVAEGAEGEKRSAEELTDERRSSESVKSAWNERRIRFGDTVPCNSEGTNTQRIPLQTPTCLVTYFTFLFQQIGNI